jgi:hypothetical protein
MKLNLLNELLEVTDECLLLAWDGVTETTRSLKVSTLKAFIADTPPVLTGASYPIGMKLWLEGGSLVDKSGNNNNATPLGANSPTIVTSTSGKQALKWDGSGTQEIQIAPFLANASGATVYCVFTASDANYNLLRTANLDDYWRFVSGAGYFGAFKNSRFEGYPATMPSSGSHLVSIHAQDSHYEILVDNVSKGIQTGNTFLPGDRFRIGTNDKIFSGDISLMLVYPSFIDKSSTIHLDCVNAIKTNYSTLPFTV